MSARRIKAIFTGEFHYSSRTRNAGWSAYPKGEPQTFPQEFIDAAVKAGKAELVPPRGASKAKEG